MSGGEYTFRLAGPGEAEQVRGFINTNFDWRLPLVNREEFFQFYYQSGEQLQFALAEQQGELIAVAGYIRAANAPGADIWVSVWVAQPGHNGAGLELMNALPALTGCGVLACNNIRPETQAFYRFLGWHTARVPHYYRLADRPAYRLAHVPEKQILPVQPDLCLDTVSSTVRLAALGLPPQMHHPHKDLWYLKRRYFGFPHLHYQVWSCSEAGQLLAYLVTRTVDTDPTGPDNVRVLRVVDFVGADAVLARLGDALDVLLRQSDAEYMDCYCWGIPARVLAKAGFCERREEDGTVIPNYLTPPLLENTEYYFFTSQPQDFVLFKADGDQDRPNLPAE